MVQTPVLIVGAGPVGLMLAAELNRHGVACRIVDQGLPRPDRESRALGVHTRTLEAIERLSPNLNETFLHEGVRGKAANFYGSGRHLVRVPLDRLDMPYPFALLLGQAVTERLLLEHLASREIAVERPADVVAFTQDDVGIEATLRNPDGREEAIEAAYVVGADGAHSAVRRLIGERFAGRALEGRYIVADARAAWGLGQRWAADEIHTFMQADAGLLIFGPLPDGRVRFVVTTPEPEAPVDGVPLARVQALVDRFRRSVEVRLSDMIWSSFFKISSRLVGRMRVGRVFLAGDAAHIHSPESGQGMNAGIQDAINLAWKLALTLRGEGGETLLDSYQAERHPVVSGIVRETERIERAIEIKSSWLARARDAALFLAGRSERARDLLANTFAANLYHYRASPIVADAVASRTTFPRTDQHAPRPGERAPDADGVRAGADRQSRRLFQVWGSDPRHKLLVLAGTSSRADRHRELAALVRAVEHSFGAGIDARLVSTEGLPGDVRTLADSGGELHRRYGTAEALYLVRPDGYVGFRSRPADEGALRDHVVRVLGLQSRSTGRGCPA